MIYIETIKFAFFLCPTLALLLAFFFVCSQYKKYGAISLYRAFVVYLFMLFCVSAYFLVILPLPDPKIVEARKGATAQLMPFEFLRAFFCDSGLSISHPNTYLKALKSRELYQPLFNFFLLFPLGFFLRYFLKLNKKKAWLVSFAVTLFFEITQYTGLYGFYLRPYRLFDVDDLLLNTTGSMLGYYVTIRIERFLPKWDKINKRINKKAQKVNLKRRLVACIIDDLMVFIFALITTGTLYMGRVIRMLVTKEVFLDENSADVRVFIKFSCINAAIYVLYYIYHINRHNGATFGKRMVKLGLYLKDKKQPSKKRLYLYYILKLLPRLVVIILHAICDYNPMFEIAPISTLRTIFIIIDSILVLDIIYSLFRFRKDYKKVYYERFTKISNYNLIADSEESEDIIESIA